MPKYPLGFKLKRGPGTKGSPEDLLANPEAFTADGLLRSVTNGFHSEAQRRQMATTTKTYGHHGRPYIFFDPIDGSDLNEKCPGQEKKHKVVHYLYKRLIAATRDYRGLTRGTTNDKARTKKYFEAHPEVGKAARKKWRQSRRGHPKTFWPGQKPSPRRATFARR